MSRSMFRKWSKLRRSTKKTETNWTSSALRERGRKRQEDAALWEPSTGRKTPAGIRLWDVVVCACILHCLAWFGVGARPCRQKIASHSRYVISAFVFCSFLCREISSSSFFSKNKKISARSAIGGLRNRICRQYASFMHVRAWYFHFIMDGFVVQRAALFACAADNPAVFCAPQWALCD